jgi:hypothetical protein
MRAATDVHHHQSHMSKVMAANRLQTALHVGRAAIHDSKGHKSVL